MITTSGNVSAFNAQKITRLLSSNGYNETIIRLQINSNQSLGHFEFNVYRNDIMANLTICESLEILPEYQSSSPPTNGSNLFNQIALINRKSSGVYCLFSLNCKSSGLYFAFSTNDNAYWANYGTFDSENCNSLQDASVPSSAATLLDYTTTNATLFPEYQISWQFLGFVCGFPAYYIY